MTAILVVEDDDDVREAMQDLLQERGYEVVTAVNGSDALEQMRARHDLGLVLLDLSMPVMDGWECREHMLKDAELVHLPVILLSGTSSLQAEQDELKAAAILAKPFAPNALLAAVARHGLKD